jgi:hypothetical protein
VEDVRLGETLPEFVQRIEAEWLRDKLRDLADDEAQLAETQLLVDWGDHKPFALSTGQSDCAAS